MWIVMHVMYFNVLFSKCPVVWSITSKSLSTFVFVVSACMSVCMWVLIIKIPSLLYRLRWRCLARCITGDLDKELTTKNCLGIDSIKLCPGTESKELCLDNDSIKLCPGTESMGLCLDTGQHRTGCVLIVKDTDACVRESSGHCHFNRVRVKDIFLLLCMLWIVECFVQCQHKNDLCFQLSFWSPQKNK